MFYSLLDDPLRDLLDEELPLPSQPLPRHECAANPPRRPASERLIDPPCDLLDWPALFEDDCDPEFDPPCEPDLLLLPFMISPL